MSWILNTFLKNSISTSSSLVKRGCFLFQKQLDQPSANLIESSTSSRYVTLWEMHVRPTFHLRKQHEELFKKPRLDGKPQMKGVILKTVIRNPKKPNSGNRKCVVVKLSNGKEATAYIPGEGNTLQEHQVVLIRGGRTKDVPGLKLKVVRGALDCAHVKK